MIKAVMNENMGMAKGLTQWDYGQTLHISWKTVIPDGVEVNFYQKELTGAAYIKDGCVKIPDLMLQDSAAITAYVYLRGENEGETILIIWLPITPRPRPDNYVLPDTEEYKRLIPKDGEAGQVLAKAGGADYCVGWGWRADGISYDGEYAQLLSGDIPVGDRVRIMKEEREIELLNDGTEIKWRYTDSNEWHTLITVKSLMGPPGPPGTTPDFEIREGHLIVKYVKEGEM